jgi:hypothetical protein
VPSRRQIAIPVALRSSADEVPTSAGLEQRVGRLELQIKDLIAVLDVQTKRTIALQAQLDHLSATGR